MGYLPRNESGQTQFIVIYFRGCVIVLKMPPPRDTFSPGLGVDGGWAIPTRASIVEDKFSAILFKQFILIHLWCFLINIFDFISRSNNKEMGFV